MHWNSAAAKEYRYWFGYAEHVTRSLQILWSSPPRGGASSLVQVQLGCAQVGHAWDRGSVPAPKDAPARAGFLQPISAGAGHFVSTFRFKTGNIAPDGRRGYTPQHKSEGYVELFAFTREYVERLREGDPSTEQHFVAYFDQLLRIKLRARRLASETIDDLCQETYIRVLANLRKGEDAVRQPERFGAYVNSICNYVLMEFYRSSNRTSPWDDSYLELPDHALNTEGLLVTKQAKERVRQVLVALPKKDHDLLWAFFIEEKDKDEVCEQFGVDRDYFRVLLHRAKDKFRVLYEKDRAALYGKLRSGVNA
jgi:RNA polymerase sigma-70 factor, ECF subfamily